MICELKIDETIKKVKIRVTSEIAHSAEGDAQLFFVVVAERRKKRYGRGIFLGFRTSLRESISSGGEGIQSFPVHISLPSGLKIAPPFSGGNFSHSLAAPYEFLNCALWGFDPSFSIPKKPPIWTDD